MVNEIYKLKNEVIEQLNKEIEARGGIERMDINRLGAYADIIKDMAEAEEKCWKAQYYRNAVTEAMESKYGYGSMTNDMGNPRQGYTVNPMGRQGYDSMGGDDIISKIGKEYRNLSPNEKMMMKSKVLSELGSM